MLKVIIAGSRGFNDYELLRDKCNFMLKDTKEIEIVSGGAKGADKLGEKYAKENNLPLTIFVAHWDTYGKSAGYIRNKEMGKYADALIAFWDGESKGTKHMIDVAKRNNLKVRIINYEVE